MGGKTITRDIFISRSNKKHDNMYDYSNMEYINSTFKVTIYCPKHTNYFTQKAAEHLIYSGCKFCRAEKARSTFIKNRESKNPLLSRFIKKHGNKYDYSNINFLLIGTDDEITIICNKHGEFRQIAYVHLNCGCPKCGTERFIFKKTRKVDEFIALANNKYNNLYDYSNINYKNMRTKILVICKKHNKEFYTTPSGHLKNSRCPSCIKETVGSLGERTIAKWLEKEKINFITEKKFETCKLNLLLRFDFYLPDYNLLIEYDGEQHFVNRNHWRSKNKFKLTQKRDNIKNIWAKDNNYRLLRIPYTDIKNIDKILSLELMELLK